MTWRATTAPSPKHLGDLEVGDIYTSPDYEDGTAPKYLAMVVSKNDQSLMCAKLIHQKDSRILLQSRMSPYRNTPGLLRRQVLRVDWRP